MFNNKKIIYILLIAAIIIVSIAVYNLQSILHKSSLPNFLINNSLISNTLPYPEIIKGFKIVSIQKLPITNSLPGLSNETEIFYYNSTSNLKLIIDQLIFLNKSALNISFNQLTALPSNRSLILNITLLKSLPPNYFAMKSIANATQIYYSVAYNNLKICSITVNYPQSTKISLNSTLNLFINATTLCFKN